MNLGIRIATLGVLSWVAWSAGAQSLQYPFVAPKCPFTIRMPSNQAGIYFSEDCKTAFVMPDRVGEMKVGDLSPTANLKRCGALSKAYASQTVLEDHVFELSKKLAATSIEKEQTRNYIRNEIDAVRASIPGMISNYEDVLGGYLQVTFASSDLRSRMDQFIIENFETLKRNNVNVSQMPIKDSYISFRAKALGGKDVRARAVLEHSIPGIAAVNADGNAPVDHTKMNGSLSGQVILSLIGACPIVENPEVDKSAWLNANMTYTVPVLSIAGYKASLDSEFAIKSLVHAWQTKSHLSVGESAEILIKGEGVSQGFRFEPYNVELPAIFTPEQRQNFFEAQRLNALERLTANLVKQMAAVGFVDLDRPALSVSAPPAGYVDEYRSGRTCSSKGPWGLFGKKCRDYTYTVKVPASSSASAMTQRIVDTKFENKEESATRETIYRVYTMAFETRRKQ